MNKITLAAGSGLAALCLASVSPAWAEAPAAPAAAPATAPAAAKDQAAQTDADAPSDIIVTGSARAERRFDVSYAVNSLSASEIKKLAPINYADLLGQLPGMQVEDTGGDVQNITRVRGIPTDDGLALFQQDGLALFPEINGYFFRGDDLNRLDLMTQRVEFVRGGPAPIFASQAAAIVNNITVTGGDQSHGEAQVTVGDTGLYRLDLLQSGKLSDNTHYAIGGFLRQGDGYRDNGFPNDRGGQIRANITHDFDNGSSVRLSVNYLNDHNVFYLPIPIADPRDPSVSLNKYINYFTGTLNSPAFRNVDIAYRDGNGVIQDEHRDLANGRHLQYGNVGLQYDGDLGDWHVSAKGGYTQGKVSFDAFYSTTNPVDAASFANSFLPAAQAAFGTAGDPVARLGYAFAGTGGQQVYDPASQSGLVMQGQYRAVDSSFDSAQGDLSVTRKFETGLGSHDLRVGVFGSIYSETLKAVYQDYLIQVQSQPSTLDLAAYDAAGNVLGYVTDNGALHDASTLNQGKVDASMIAFYANDTWQIADKLRLDAGVRHERYAFNGFALLSTTANLGDPTTLADDNTRAFTGAIQRHHLTPDVTNWTVGLNYDLTHQLGAYVRASHLEVPPSAVLAANVNPTIVTTKANQYEVGLKASFGRSYLYLTGFYTKFNPLNASFVAFNPQTGQNDQSVPFVGEASVKGIEADGALNVVRGFAITGALTVQDPKYVNLVNSAGADPSAVNGNQIVREPKVFGNIRPTYSFAVAGNDVQIYGRYDYTGRRFVDFFNNTALPAYGTFGAGATITHGSWQFQVVGDNITNAHGLTEGNTRTDQLAGQGTADAIYGRPIFGRNFRFVLSKSW